MAVFLDNVMVFIIGIVMTIFFPNATQCSIDFVIFALGAARVIIVTFCRLSVPAASIRRVFTIHIFWRCRSFLVCGRKRNITPLQLRVSPFTDGDIIGRSLVQFTRFLY